MSESFERGLQTRKEVLGAEYVEISIKNATPFDLPFQEFVTESAWGNVWTKGPLDRKTKSIITLSVLVALRAEDEIALHIRGAVNNGVTPEEIMGLLIHASVYAGVPSSLSAVRVARRVLTEMGKINA